MLCNEGLTFESVDKVLKCYHSNESYWAVLSCGTVYYAVQGGSYFWVCGWNPKVWPFKWKHSFGAVYYAVQGDWLWRWNTMNSSVTIKKKAAGKNFRVVLTLYYVVEGGGDFGGWNPEQ